MRNSRIRPVIESPDSNNKFIILSCKNHFTVVLDMLFMIVVCTYLAAATVSNGQTCSDLDTDVIIMGGGLSGLGAANTLQDRRMKDFLLFEAQPQLGGRAFVRRGDTSWHES